MVENYLEVVIGHETLQTERLMLRRFEKRDAEDILRYGSDEETLKYLTWDGVTTLEAATRAIVEYYWSRPGIYAIEMRESDRCVGCIDLRLIPEHDKAGFGYVIAREHWGQGYMTEALFALLHLCFEKLDLNRVESTHYIGNEGSGRVMEKCGMVFEGIGKQEVKIKGIYHDVAHYGMTRERWSSLHPQG